MSDIISMQGISRVYKMGDTELHALRDVSICIAKGEFVAILGPSGSGKSTLMNIIGCMDLASCGQYLLDGVAIGQNSDWQLSRIRNEKIGFIFQKYHLISKYTVLQNVALPLLIRGQSYRQAKEAALQSLSRVGLSDRLGHKPHELSGGQQQRAAIARALVSNPSILLADEPTGALDSVTSNEIIALMEELNRQGNTVVVITHNQSVAQHAHRVIHILDGRVCDCA